MKRFRNVALLLGAFAACSFLFAGEVKMIALTDSAVVREQGRVVWLEIDQCHAFGLPLITSGAYLWRVGQKQFAMNPGETIHWDFYQIRNVLGNDIGDGWTVQPLPCRVRLWIEK